MRINKQQQWGYWFLLPIYPYQQRPTLREEVVSNYIWIFDQPHGFLYAVVPIRMTIVRLQKGGLLVYCPIAPTPECIKLVRELEAQYGEVKYIIHSTISGLEHKIFVGPFARYFPLAQVWSAPSQWSFPLNLPLSWLGFPRGRTHILPLNWQKSPLADEFEYQIVTVRLSAGAFGEVALFHRPTRTMLVTDSVIQIPEKPPAIITLNPFPLLFHARETSFDDLENTPQNLLKGWQRICLFAIYFRPSMIDTINIYQLLQEAQKAPNRSRINYFGLYPFRWQKDWLRSFQAIVRPDEPLVAPILQTLILPQDIDTVSNWVNKIALWPFEQIIPAHFSAPIKATSKQFKQAFNFLEPNSFNARQLYPSGNEQIFRQDSTFIKRLTQFFVWLKIAQSSPLDK